MRVRLGYRPLERADLPHLGAWLSDSEVRRSWPDDPSPDALEARYGPCIDGRDPTEVLVVEVDDEPSGIIQRYRMTDEPEWRTTLGLAIPALTGLATAGIDYLLGRPEVRNRGIGSRVVDEVSAGIFDGMAEIEMMVVAVQQDNRHSWRALERAGYRRVWAGTLATDDPSDAGPAHLLTRLRPQLDGPRAPAAIAPRSSLG